MSFKDTLEALKTAELPEALGGKWDAPGPANGGGGRFWLHKPWWLPAIPLAFCPLSV